jgi:hypothetical protein
MSADSVLLAANDVLNRKFTPLVDDGREVYASNKKLIYSDGLRLVSERIDSGASQQVDDFRAARCVQLPLGESPTAWFHWLVWPIRSSQSSSYMRVHSQPWRSFTLLGPAIFLERVRTKVVSRR